jgi:hypothetical protein
MNHSIFSTTPVTSLPRPRTACSARGGAPGLGATPIIMAFVILCLTIFAALTLSTASAEYNLSKAYVNASRDYYAADAEGVRFVAALEAEAEASGYAAAAEALGADVSYSGGEIHITRDFEIGDSSQVLRVSLAADDAGLRITSWRIVYAGEWAPGNTFNLWTGE